MRLYKDIVQNSEDWFAIRYGKVGGSTMKDLMAKKEECSVAYLQGQKPFILNRTNQKMISKVLGSPYIEDWAGHWITIYPTTTTVAGEVTECLRVRPTKPVLADISKEIEADINALNKCTTLSELQNVYKALKHKADNKVIAVKDKLKTELK